MRIRRRGAAIEVVAHAKLNLFLEVFGKRGDGFHEIETLMLPITLADTLSFEATHGPGIELSCRLVHARHVARAADAALPMGDENLVVRAAKLVASRAGRDLGARIDLTKRVPLAAGLAGGSSDAAATLLAANLAWGLDWSRERLAELAAELGSDVPFFLGDGAAVCRGRGERIEPLPARGKPHFVIARPPRGLSTADVYRRCQPATSATALGAVEISKAVTSGRWSAVGKLLHNRLRPAAEALEPSVASLAGEFARLDLWGHQMSGSGTAYFGICRDGRHARRAASVLRSRKVGEVFTVRGA